MSSILILSALVAASATKPSLAPDPVQSADTPTTSSVPSPDVVVHFPLLWVALIGGFDSTPVGYTAANGASDSLNALNGIVGPDVIMHVDTNAFLLELEGFYNPAGDLRWTARAHATFGFRDTHHLIRSISDSPANSSGYYTETTTYYVHKFVPVYLGLTAGISLWGFGTTTATSYADSTPLGSRGPAVVPVLDAALAVRSPQIEFTVGPEYSASGGNLGLRFALGVAFPIGEYPLFFRSTVDDLFGDDPTDNSGRRTSIITTFSLGMGSSLGTGS